MSKSDSYALKAKMQLVFAEKVDDPHILYSEPAKAAAERLANYWSGMGPNELGFNQMELDLERMVEYLRKWVLLLRQELPEDTGSRETEVER